MNRRPPITLAIAAVLSSSSAMAADEDMRALLKQLSQQVAELKQHSEQSDSRIRELENNLQVEREKNRQLSVAGKDANPPQPVQTAAAEPKKDSKPAVTVGDTKGTFKIPGTDTSLGFGGFVKLDVNENSVSAGSASFGDQYLSISQIPVSHTGEDSQLTFNARESRFWLKSFTPSQWGDINTYLELDLYGSASAYTPRLRHAYGSFGNFLAGQTWTTFLNELSAADTLDNGGPVGMAKLRQPLVRWTQPFKVANQDFEFQVAAEAPASTIWTSSWTPTQPGLVYDSLTATGDDRYPDMIARINYKPAWGNLSLAAMGRQIRNTSTAGLVREQWGGGISLAGKVNVYELDNVRFTFNYGNAIGRYSSVNKLEDAALDSAGNLHLVNVYSGVVAYQHWWNKVWRSTFAYGLEQADQPDFVDEKMTRQAQSVHANLLWSPLPQATLGIEYIYGTRELIDGRNGNISRAQFSAKYNF